jgi:hypothetical protein
MNVRTLVLVGFAVVSQIGIAHPVAVAQSTQWRAGSVEHSTAPHAFGANCRSKLVVNGQTTVDTKYAGGLAIDSWKREAERVYGAGFSNFKAAREPVARCRQTGSNPLLQCFVSGNPCLENRAPAKPTVES